MMLLHKQAQKILDKNKLNGMAEKFEKNHNFLNFYFIVHIYFIKQTFRCVKNIFLITQ